MQVYEIATLSIQMGKAGNISAGVKAFCEQPEAKGRLLGIWNNDIGILNQVLVLRGFADEAEAADERRRTLTAADPFNAAEWVENFSFDTYKPFPFTQPVETGNFGAVYEIRTYGVKTGCLPKVFEVWEQAVPERTQFSRMTAALYSTDGSPRIVSIWPYASVNDRSRIRAESVAAGVWPPKGGPACLTNDMVSVIGIPTAESPLK